MCTSESQRGKSNRSLPRGSCPERPLCGTRSGLALQPRGVGRTGPACASALSQLGVHHHPTPTPHRPGAAHDMHIHPILSGVKCGHPAPPHTLHTRAHVDTDDSTHITRFSARVTVRTF